MDSLSSNPGASASSRTALLSFTFDMSTLPSTHHRTVAFRKSVAPLQSALSASCRSSDTTVLWAILFSVGLLYTLGSLLLFKRHYQNVVLNNSNRLLHKGYLQPETTPCMPEKPQPDEQTNSPITLNIYTNASIYDLYARSFSLSNVSLFLTTVFSVTTLFAPELAYVIWAVNFGISYQEGLYEQHESKQYYFESWAKKLYSLYQGHLIFAAMIFIGGTALKALHYSAVQYGMRKAHEVNEECAEKDQPDARTIFELYKKALNKMSWKVTVALMLYTITWGLIIYPEVVFEHTALLWTSGNEFYSSESLPASPLTSDSLMYLWVCGVVVQAGLCGLTIYWNLAACYFERDTQFLMDNWEQMLASAVAYSDEKQSGHVWIGETRSITSLGSFTNSRLPGSHVHLHLVHGQYLLYHIVSGSRSATEHTLLISVPCFEQRRAVDASTAPSLAVLTFSSSIPAPSSAPRLELAPTLEALFARICTGATV